MKQSETKKKKSFKPLYSFNTPTTRYIIYKMNNFNSEKDINSILNNVIQQFNKDKKFNKMKYNSNMNQINGIIQNDFENFKTEKNFTLMNSKQRFNSQITLKDFDKKFFEMIFHHFNKIDDEPIFNVNSIENPYLYDNIIQKRSDFKEVLSLVKEDMTEKSKNLIYETFASFALNIILTYPLDLKPKEYEIDLTFDNLIESYITLLGMENIDTDRHPLLDHINILQNELDIVDSMAFSGFIGLSKLYFRLKNKPLFLYY